MADSRLTNSGLDSPGDSWLTTAGGERPNPHRQLPLFRVAKSCLKMWPHIRINTRNIIILFFAMCILYLLHSVSTPARLRRIPIVSSISMAHVPEEVDPFQINLKQLLIACIQASEAGGQHVYNVRKPKSGDSAMDVRAKEGGKGEGPSLVTKGDLASHRVIVHGLSATFTGLQVISEENHQEDEADNEEEIVKPFHLTHEPILFSEEISSLPADLHVPLKQLTIWVDPLDATQEYAESLEDESLLKYVTVMICIAMNSRPIIGIIHKPFEHKTFWAWDGVGMSDSLRELVLLSANSTDTSKPKIIVSRSHAGSVEQFLKSRLGENIQVTQAGGAGYKTLQVVSGASSAYVHKSIIKKWDICAPHAIIESLNGKMTTLTGGSISYSAEDAVVNSGGLIAATSNELHALLVEKLKT